MSQEQERSSQRRCFTCRSRGERGDCRDPFTLPEELEEGAQRRESVNRAVAQIPCSTGWCSKVFIIVRSQVNPRVGLLFGVQSV